MSEPQHRELLGLSNQELTELLESFAQAPYRLRQLLDGLYRQRWSRLEQFTTLSLSFRGQLADSGYSVGQPTIEKRFTSSDGTVRYLFAFPDGQSVETVWMPEGDGGEAGDGSDSGDDELAELSQKLSSRGRTATEGSAFTDNRQLTTGNSFDLSSRAQRPQGAESRDLHLSSRAQPSGVEGPAFTDNRQLTTGNSSALSSRAQPSGIEGPTFTDNRQLTTGNFSDLSSRARPAGVEGPAFTDNRQLTTGNSSDLSSRAQPSGIEGPAFTDNRQLTTGNFFRRATICVSSQVGCAVDCAFCMTALLGLHRNLTAGEIVGQVLAVLSDQQVEIDRDRINLVFMGQGEPFLNYDNFMQAVRTLVFEAGIPASRMTVSTSGIVPRIADFGAEEIRPKLAVSLNAPNEALRTEVMPITKKWTIEKLLAALRDFPLRNRERLTFEYVLLGGVNDSPSHARELVDLIRGLRAKVNLIALNPGPEIPFSMPDTDRVLAFQSVLMNSGIPTFIRRPRGRDIYAACGQLKHTTELVQLS